MITKNCKQCNKEFKVHNYRKDTALFCSKKCKDKSLNGKISPRKGIKTEKPAWNTGLKGYKSGESNNMWKGGKPKCLDCNKQLGGYRGKRCPACNKLWQKGENIYNYKGLPKQERTDYDYKIWRLSVFERDWFTCQYPGCGYKGKDIQGHHIKKYKNYPELRLDKNNGITLCKSCHNKTRNKEEMFEELFTNIINLSLS